jgi:hypothetical protein
MPMHFASSVPRNKRMLISHPPSASLYNAHIASRHSLIFPTVSHSSSRCCYPFASSSYQHPRHLSSSDAPSPLVFSIDQPSVHRHPQSPFSFRSINPDRSGPRGNRWLIFNRLNLQFGRIRIRLHTWAIFFATALSLTATVANYRFVPGAPRSSALGLDSN